MHAQNVATQIGRQTVACSAPGLTRQLGNERRFGGQMHGVCGNRRSLPRRLRQQSVTAAFWGGGDDRRPSSKNVLDTTMAWGDILTLLATELASERVPVSVCGIHCTVTILAWVGVATAKGDYRYRPPNFLFGAQQKAMLLACFSGALTWALFVPTVLAGYASMVTHHVLDSSLLVQHGQSHQLPAQLEVIFASLWSVASWRGVYAGLRPYI
ncbi:g12888 [Coccomyxa viridis]|uniref:G12888 protein n=1 Tax=Coccomyxa viridis TaxID=1274662 RepID=A0ABP1GFL5_9CHLO